jgi:hypothetical protein
MDRSDLQETLFTLYLRLNGYFVTGFIVHAAQGNTTELDALAVRFPFHKEPEREVEPCEQLCVPQEKLDFIICEVKGGNNNANFNYAFRSNKNAVMSVLNRFGAFEGSVINELADKILESIKPEYINKSSSMPVVNIANREAQIRCVLVAPDQSRSDGKNKPYIYGDDIVAYIWKCFRPENKRESCGVIYNWNLWGEQYQKLVEYFKDQSRTTPGKIEDIYKYCGL